MESNNSSSLFLNKSIAQLKTEISIENDKKHVDILFYLLSIFTNAKVNLLFKTERDYG